MWLRNWIQDYKYVWISTDYMKREVVFLLFCVTLIIQVYIITLINQGYFFFFEVVLPLSTKHPFCANCVPSLFLWEILFYNSITYYDFCTFVQWVYNLEAVSPEFCYNIVPVTLSGGENSESPPQNGLSNENDLSSPQTGSHKVGQLWESSFVSPTTSLRTGLLPFLFHSAILNVQT